jgi:hypothetical protein
MLRIVDGMVYEGKPSADRWEVVTHDLGVHREASVRRCTDWVESGPLDPDSIAAQVLRGEREDPNAVEKREANARRAARRAKTRVRRLCKSQGLDTLLTLTYRAVQADLDLAKHHFQLLAKRMARALGGFCYVAAFEPQKRGAWHVHVVTHRLPAVIVRQGVKIKSWNVIRAMWRDIVGELGGNIDVSGRRKLLRSAAKCAAYVSKYVMKAFEEGEDHSKRYLASRCEIPAPVRQQMAGVAAGEVRELMAAAFEWCSDGRSVASVWLSRFGDTFFVAGELPP